MQPSSLPTAIFLMGPTASGKTALAVQLAQALDTEIISVDSALVFKGMDIGTAKPTLEERGGIQHHLMDILDPSASFSTGQFRASALGLMASITRRGKIPVLVGGTGLYFRALCNGLAVLPEADFKIRARLHKELSEFGCELLHRRLASVDPQAAARIHPNDPQRLQRALEVYEISGKPISAYFLDQASDFPYRPIKFILAPTERKTLHDLIARRFHAMLAKGLLEEVAGLHGRGDLTPDLPAMKAVGYRHAWAYLDGDCDYATMTEKAIAATRQLAKRQFTWLRKETNAVWLAAEDNGLLARLLTELS